MQQDILWLVGIMILIMLVGYISYWVMFKDGEPIPLPQEEMKEKPKVRNAKVSTVAPELFEKKTVRAKRVSSK